MQDDPVGGDAGLTGVAELTRNGFADGEVDVGVGEDDERPVPAELHGRICDVLGRLLQQATADTG